jgi:crossover junction endodeoxyribonuclease RuvC
VARLSCATTTPLWGVGVERRRDTARKPGGAKGGAVWGLNALDGWRKDGTNERGFRKQPGAHGATPRWTNGATSSRSSSTPQANGRTATNAPLLAGILARTYACIAFCEFVGARPTDAKVAAFAFGRARGVIEGCAGALGLPIVFLTPPTWKRLADIPPGTENKDLARTRAIARWPARADLFARKCDVDPAEACLIALAGLQRESRR